VARKKLKKIREVSLLPNVFELLPGQSDVALDEYFGNRNRLTLEIGCGRGDYSRALAKCHPSRNFVGVDVKGARLWTGARMAVAEGSTNVAFLRARAEELDSYFQPGRIEELWIPFPDPFPKKRGQKRRVTAPGFLKIYSGLLVPDGKVHLKTDDTTFWEFTLEQLKSRNLPLFERVEDLYASNIDGPAANIQTKYEEAHLAAGKTIMYVCFGFRGKGRSGGTG